MPGNVPVIAESEKTTRLNGQKMKESVIKKEPLNCAEQKKIF
jgi:hypothetical protein